MQYTVVSYFLTFFIFSHKAKGLNDLSDENAPGGTPVMLPSMPVKHPCLLSLFYSPFRVFLTLHTSV